MLNVYFTVQTLRRGLPLSSSVKLIKHRKLADRSEAFSDVLNTFADQATLGGDDVFRPYLSEFATLLGTTSAKGKTGASAMVGDVVLIVSYLEGEECEVARRAY